MNNVCVCMHDTLFECFYSMTRVTSKLSFSIVLFTYIMHLHFLNEKHVYVHRISVLSFKLSLICHEPEWRYEKKKPAYAFWTEASALFYPYYTSSSLFYPSMLIHNTQFQVGWSHYSTYLCCSRTKIHVCAV